MTRTSTTSVRDRLDSLRRVTTNRLARLYADAVRVGRRTGSASPALEVFGPADRSDLDVWIETTARCHDAYRSAVEPLDDRVAVICSSNRPGDLPNTVRSIAAQAHAPLELIFVAHGDHWNLADVEESLAGIDGRLDRVRVLHLDATQTLGACLNAALAATDARFVAKFDSDDHYGANYLVDALRAHRYAGAGIVGKNTYFAHLELTGEYVLRFPGNEFRYTSTMAGGTFVIDRDIVDDQRFADVSIGEDRDFIAHCHRRGISTFSGDRFNYTIVRSGTNTWTISADEFSSRSIALGTDIAPGVIER